MVELTPSHFSILVTFQMPWIYLEMNQNGIGPSRYLLGSSAYFIFEITGAQIRVFTWNPVLTKEFH